LGICKLAPNPNPDRYANEDGDMQMSCWIRMMKLPRKLGGRGLGDVPMRS
jgi:hypothetical protein